MKLSEIDSTLLRYADSRSPAELSLLIDSVLTPEECAERVSALLEKPDWLTLTQQDAIVTQKMRSLITELETQPRSTRNAEVLVRALEALGTRLEKRASGIDADLNRLYAWQGAAFIGALEDSLDHLKKRLPALTSVSEADWNGAVEEALRRAGARFAALESGGGGVITVPAPSASASTSPAIESPRAARASSRQN